MSMLFMNVSVNFKSNIHKQQFSCLLLPGTEVERISIILGFIVLEPVLTDISLAIAKICGESPQYGLPKLLSKQSQWHAMLLYLTSPQH